MRIRWDATNIALGIGAGLAAWWVADAALISNGNKGLAFPFRMKSTEEQLEKNQQLQAIDDLKKLGKL
jgi:hypothetical protein